MRKGIGQSNSRRGATMVLVAVLIVVMGGMAAFAVDLSRIYSGVNEMQTGADAAALAGALRLQLIAAANPVGGVQAFGASNSAFGSAIEGEEKASAIAYVPDPLGAVPVITAYWLVKPAVVVLLTFESDQPDHEEKVVL